MAVPTHSAYAELPERTSYRMVQTIKASIAPETPNCSPSANTGRPCRLTCAELLTPEASFDGELAFRDRRGPGGELSDAAFLARWKAATKMPSFSFTRICWMHGRSRGLEGKVIGERQRDARRQPAMKIATSLLSLGVLLNAFAQLGLKAATRVTGPLVTPEGGTVESRARADRGAVAVVCTERVCGAEERLVVWLVGLSRVPVTQAYPLLSMGYVINIGLAWWLLGEIPNAQRVIGIGVIVGGVVLVARS